MTKNVPLIILLVVLILIFTFGIIYLLFSYDKVKSKKNVCKLNDTQRKQLVFPGYTGFLNCNMDTNVKIDFRCFTSNFRNDIKTKISEVKNNIQEEFWRYEDIGKVWAISFNGTKYDPRFELRVKINIYKDPVDQQNLVQNLTRSTIDTRVKFEPIFLYDKVLLKTGSTDVITKEQIDKMLYELKNDILCKITNIDIQYIVVKYKITCIQFLPRENDEKYFNKYFEKFEEGWEREGKGMSFTQFYNIKIDQMGKGR